MLTNGKEKESQTNGLDIGHLPVRLVDGTRLVRFPQVTLCLATSFESWRCVLRQKFNVLQVDKEWLVADLKDSEVVFGPEDISEVINTVMGVPDR